MALPSNPARFIPVVMLVLVVGVLGYMLYGGGRQDRATILQATARKMVDRTCQADVACRAQLEPLIETCSQGAIAYIGQGRKQQEVLDQAAFAKCCEQRTGRKVQLLIGEF